MVNKNTIDDCIWKIQKILMEKYGCTAADREIAPLIWYINTGRASTLFLKSLIDAESKNLYRFYGITDRHSNGVPFLWKSGWFGNRQKVDANLFVKNARKCLH